MTHKSLIIYSLKTSVRGGRWGNVYFFRVDLGLVYAGSVRLKRILNQIGAGICSAAVRGEISEMKRRELFRGTVAIGASAALMRPAKAAGRAESAPQKDKNPFPKVSGLTSYVAEFALKLRYEDIPAVVVALAKKSILDGFGLALAGS